MKTAYDILSKYGISPPPEITGIAGQGNNTLYSMNGKWYNQGQTTKEGYKIGAFDPKTNTVGMEIHGTTFPHPIKINSPTEYVSPNEGNASSYISDHSNYLPSQEDYRQIMLNRNKAIFNNNSKEWEEMLKKGLVKKGETHQFDDGNGGFHEFTLSPDSQ